MWKVFIGAGVDFDDTRPVGDDRDSATSGCVLSIHAAAHDPQGLRMGLSAYYHFHHK